MMIYTKNSLSQTKMDKVKLLNIDICSIYQNDLLKELNHGVVFTPNVDHLVKLQKDREFYEVYKKADWVICDSNILKLAAKFLKKPIKEVIPGSSFFTAFYEYHRSNRNVRIFLLGSAQGVASQAMDIINKKTGWNIVVGAHSPSFGFEINESECEGIVDIVNESNANVLIVGVGAPKQEKWIMKYKDQLNKMDIIMALGATIDFEAGKLSRAPSFYRKMHIEWLFRLFQDPGRLWKRYLVEDIAIVGYFFKQKFGFYRNPFS
jgi:N-acetylglucosaminyldiphosphoundecaprenol N-acetyl-beta-D-mannosaminyltransferase